MLWSADPMALDGVIDPDVVSTISGWSEATAIPKGTLRHWISGGRLRATWDGGTGSGERWFWVIKGSDLRAALGLSRRGVGREERVYHSRQAAAAAAGVRVRTLTRWLKSGKLKARGKKGGGGWIRIRHLDLMAAKAKAPGIQREVARLDRELRETAAAVARVYPGGGC